MPKKEPATKTPDPVSSPNLWVLGAATGGAAAAGWIASSWLSSRPHEEEERKLRAAIQQLEGRLAHTAASNKTERGELEGRILQLQEQLVGMDQVESGMHALLETVEDLSKQLAQQRPWNMKEPLNHPLVEEFVLRVLQTKIPQAIGELQERIARERNEWVVHAETIETRMLGIQTENRTLRQLLHEEHEQAREAQMRQDALETEMRAIVDRAATIEEECEKRMQTMATVQAAQLNAGEEAHAFEMKSVLSRYAALEEQATEMEALRARLLEHGVAQGVESRRLTDLEAENGEWRQRWAQEAEPALAQNASLQKELDAYRDVEGQEDRRLKKVQAMVQKMRELVPTGAHARFDSIKTGLTTFISHILASQKQALQAMGAIGRELETTRRHFKAFKESNVALMAGYRQTVESVVHRFVEAVFAREHPGVSDAHAKQSFMAHFMDPLSDALNGLSVPS